MRLFKGFASGPSTSRSCVIVIIGTAFVLMVMLWMIVSRTRMGKAMRATASTARPRR